MLPRIEDLRVVLEQVIADRAERGPVRYEVDGLHRERVAAAPDSSILRRAGRHPHRERGSTPRRGAPTGSYVEPEELAEIEAARLDLPRRMAGSHAQSLFRRSWAECPDLPDDPLRPVDLDDARRRTEAGFLGSVCGCVLGKPVEVRTTMAKLRAAAEATGEWPIRDYLTEAMLDALGDRHRSWPESVRERIRFVARDDDINYTVLGMLILEQHGIGYRRIHDRYGCYGHCQIYQETGTLINTLRFAPGVEEGICMQVSQGNDTDSYGATAGSLLGVLHGRPPEQRWLAPFNDEIRTTVAGLYESSLTRVAERMGRLPHVVAEQL